VGPTPHGEIISVVKTPSSGSESCGAVTSGVEPLSGSSDAIPNKDKTRIATYNVTSDAGIPDDVDFFASPEQAREFNRRLLQYNGCKPDAAEFSSRFAQVKTTRQNSVDETDTEEDSSTSTTYFSVKSALSS
jgi:hypothetical protein